MLNQGRLCPKETLSNVWRHFWLRHLGGSNYRSGQGRGSPPRGAQGSPATEGAGPGACGRARGAIVLTTMPCV